MWSPATVDSGQVACATPEASGLKVALSQASMATPAKPTTRPSRREWLGLSLSQSQATSAPNIGTVALRMADSPVVIDSSANEKQANGMPELNRPTRNSDSPSVRFCTRKGAA